MARRPAFLEARPASLRLGETLLGVVIGARCAFSWEEILAKVWAKWRTETRVGRSVPNNVDAEYVEKRYDANSAAETPRVTSRTLSWNQTKGGGTLLVAREGAAPTPSELSARDDVLEGVPLTP